MAKVSAAYLRRQAEVLQKHHGERDRTRVAAEIGVSTDQYKRYLLGITMFRPDLVIPLARAYGVAADALALELGIIERAAQPWSIRAVLEAAGFPSERVTHEENQTADWPIEDQQAYVSDLMENERKRQDVPDQKAPTGRKSRRRAG